MQLDKIDANKILGQLLSSGAATGIAGALAGGMLVSKSGRKLGAKAAELGGLTAAAPPTEALSAVTLSGFLPPRSDPEAAQALGITLIRTMIAAARADGKLDGREGEAVFRAVDSLELAAAEKALLLDELGKPVDIDQLVATAHTPEIASEIYAAALLAIERDTPAEQAWLAMLAARLELEEALVAQLEGRVESAHATA